MRPLKSSSSSQLTPPSSALHSPSPSTSPLSLAYASISSSLYANYHPLITFNCSNTSPTSSQSTQQRKKMSSRPELQAPIEIFYNDEEVRKYTSSSRIIDIQDKLSERALELLALADANMPRLLARVLKMPTSMNQIEFGS